MAKEIITTSDVEKVAKLSRLEFSASEIENIKKNLGEIVDYFGVLNEVNTTNVEPIVKPEGTLREDVIKTSLTAGEIVKNAPHHSSNAFIVPKVVE